MIPYASAMGAGRNRDALKSAGWRLLINPMDPRDTEGFKHCLDNGAWAAFQKWMKARLAEGMTEADAMAAWCGGRWVEAPLDEEAFERALERYGPTADFVVLPDIVAGGMASLALSLRHSNRVMAATNIVLIAVQDGMEPEDLAPYVGPRVGIFLGGSTEWKLERMEDWGIFCAEQRCWYHVARVNTRRRFRLAHAAGATSVDGSSVTKFADTLPLLEAARIQPDLFAPEGAMIIPI